MTTVLVTGATGNVGRVVVRELVRSGARVRALTRDPSAAALPAGVDLVRGDLTDPEGLPLRGVDRIYLFPVPETAREVVARAAEAGVRRIVTLSSGAVTAGLDSGFHLPVEQAVEDSGLEWTHVRAGEFALNKLFMWGPSIRDSDAIWDPFPDSPGCPMHEADIAEVAVKALLDNEHVGRAYTLTGPRVLTSREQAAQIARARGRDVRFLDVTREQALAHYERQGGWAAAMARFMLGFESYSGGEPEPVEVELAPLPTVEQVLGKPARTFAQWAQDHAGGFR
ncbi:SDR family oxidoreductase [Kutzneria albida]|uniref:NmrA-like domain-containing protein n=1 Tax=Kutzneria albida DSM 43870 TaxID=1449976 RepID=W5WRZ6_9PSEU|nr:NAD(P)H-binding protein [Kutzneria albida]AHI00945.1 hypothetical protein KALB_7587 [Kutzneria albida DSM 43870]